jgi:hypothetical protein
LLRLHRRIISKGAELSTEKIQKKYVDKAGANP